MKRSVYWVFAAFACSLAMGCGGGTDNMGIDDMEITATQCQDDEDNDSDELTDCDDPDCQGYVFCVDTGGDSDTDTDTDTDTDEDPLDCEGGRYDESTGLCWQHPKADGTFTWQEAIDYCDALELAGHTDWVLPTRQDFVDMLDNCDDNVLGGEWGYCDSCEESDMCSDLFGSDADWYWSSTTDYDHSGRAWRAAFNFGSVGSASVDLVYNVRCMRHGP